MVEVSVRRWLRLLRRLCWSSQMSRSALSAEEKNIAMQKIWKVILLFVLLLCGAKRTLAQESENAQQETVRKLQEKLDHLKSQMNAVQAELDTLRTTTPPAHEARSDQPVPKSSRTGTIENTGPPAPSVGQI